MKPGLIVAFCGILIAASAISIDTTLPVLPAILADLGGSYAAVQMTITIYMFASGFSQVLWGPLSDGWGRRPVLALGLAAYLVGCLVATLAPTVDMLLVGRFLQGFGGAAAIVIGRTILRDLYTGQTLARHMAMASAVFAAGPIVAPFFGGGFAVLAGWRGVFAVLAALAVLALLVLIKLPETVPQRVASPLAPRLMRERLMRILREPQSRHFLIVGVVAMSTMAFIIASSARLYDENFRLTGLAFTVYFALHGFGIVIGQFANRRLITQIGTVGAMKIGCSVLIVAAMLLLGTALSGYATAASTTAIFILYATSFMIVFSNSAALVLDPHGQIAGFAASIYGFVTQGGSAIIASVLVTLVGGSLVLFSSALLTLCMLCMLLLMIWPADRVGGPSDSR